jgi:hypothetical protein
MHRTGHTVNRPQILTRSVSDYALRDHALGVQSFPRQDLFISSPVYFCVHCGNGFEKRGDWETHEWIFHERQSYWPCPQSGCDAVFDSGKSFEAHHEAMHFCDGCNHSAECVRLLPERKVWACGFDGCKAVFLDWSKRCKHVASHYEGLARRIGANREAQIWKYTTTVRNLLRQPDTRETFKKFMIKCHGHSKAGWPTLEWQRDSSAELKRCLEYRDFPNGVGEIVQQAYRLGHPAHAAAIQVMSRPPTPPAEDVGFTTLSPVDAYFGSTAARSRSQRSYLYERKASNASSGVRSVSSDNRQYRSAASLPSSPPSASPPGTRNVSRDRAGSFTSETASMASSRLAGRKRLVAREAEVRNTSCSALASFLRDGPSEVPEKIPESRQPRAPYRAPRMPPPVPPPRARLVAREAEVHNTRNSTLINFLKDGPPADPREERNRHIPTPRSPSLSRSVPRTIGSPFPDYIDDEEDCLSWPIFPEPPVVAVNGPQENPKPAARAPRAPMQNPQLREIKIQETVLTLPRSSSLNDGTRVLPPTPGPPPMQALPAPPTNSTLSPLSGGSRNFSHLMTPVSPGEYTFGAAEPPPSPMPPGFEDMQWPLPPSPTPEVSPLQSTPTPTVEFFRGSTPTPGSFSAHRQAKSPAESEFSKSPTSDRPRTAHGLRIDVPKLMAAPPKRSKSMHRSGSKNGRGWGSVSSVAEPPLPSPDIDFGFCLQQPLDLMEFPSVPNS